MRPPFRSLLADPSLSPSLAASRYRASPGEVGSIRNPIHARPPRSWLGLPSLRSCGRDLLAASVLLLFSLLSPAQAEILFADDFSRPDGPIVELPGTPWRTLLGTPAQIRTVGGSLRLQEGEPETVEAPLAGQPITNRPVYAGFTATVSALPSGDSFQHFAAFSIVNGPRPLSRVVITTQGAAPGKFRIGVTHGFTGTGGLPAPTGIIPVDLSLNTPFRLVLRQGLPSPLSTVWVNPTTEEGGADNSDEGTFLPASIVGFMFRQRLLDGQGIGTVTVDDLVVATTFDEVKSAPVPPPPTEPRMLGRWPVLPRVNANGFTAHEGYLYVPSLSALRVFDIRDPANRQQVMVPEAPQITGGPLVVAGNRAYTAGDGLSVLDVSTPANPRMLGFLPVTEISGNAIAVADQHVFILDAGFTIPPGSTDPNPAGLHVVDVSDPAQPRKVSFVNAPTFYYTDLIVSGGYAYTQRGNGAGSDIFDVRDPRKPTLVGNFPSYLLAVSGQRAYVSSSDGRLQIFDFSDPTNPVLLGTESTGPEYYNRMRLDGDLAYVTGGTSLFIYDISNPAVPRRIGRSDGGVKYIGGFTVWNKRAFFTGRSTLDVFDATDPTRPRLEVFDPNDLAARVRNPFEDAFGDATDVALDGGYAFVADPTGGLHVIDVSDSAQPRRVASVGTNAVHVSVNDGYAYVRKGIQYDASSEALEIYDVREPRTPRLLKSVILPTVENIPVDHILGVHVSGKHCYVGSQRDGLMVFDVSLPANPRQLGKIWPGPSRMVTSGNYLFSLNSYLGGLPIFDISNPSQPRLTGHGEPLIANDVAVSGHQAFWAHTSGVLVDNVSNPARPVRLGRLSDASAATALAASRSHLYVAADDKALTVYALNPSGVPTAVSSTTNQYRSINRLQQAGGKLFATVKNGFRAKDGGLLIFSDPFAPAPPTLSGIRRDASGVIRLTLKGSAGSPFTLERSTNLLRWENWIEGTLLETDSAGRELLDDSTILKAHQFYRARSQ